MKLSATALFLAIAGTAASASVPQDQAAIRVKCQDLDWDRLSLAEKNQAAASLERSFNHVSSRTDQEMQGVKWVPAPASEMVRLGHFHALVHQEASLKDDNCWLCLDDDDSFVKDGSTNSHQVEFMQLWQNQLEYYFQESPYSAFARAHECQIEVEMAAAAAAAKQEGVVVKEMKESTPGSTTTTLLDVQCHNLNWARLTSTEQSFVAANLARAFHTVSGGKKNLQHLQWEMVSANEPSFWGQVMGATGSMTLGHFSGVLEQDEEDELKDDNCWLCLDDDDSFQGNRVRGSTNQGEAAFLERWARELERNIQEGPYSSLSHAFDCSVTMAIKGQDIEM